jgi:hypothetical protein
MTQGRILLNKQLRVWLILVLTIVSTPFFAQARINFFSAYAACRWKAINTEGYGIWRHTDTKQMVFLSEIAFYDGINELTCYSVGVGPFWIVVFSPETLVGCLKGVGLCPRGHFGVDP